MAVSKLLQTPQIIEITGSTIKIAHPNISKNFKTALGAPISAAGTAQRLEDHMEADEKKFSEIDASLKHIFQCLDALRDNHLTHIQSSINDVKQSLQDVKSDVRWIKAIGGLIVIQALTFIADLVSRLVR